MFIAHGQNAKKDPCLPIVSPHEVLHFPPLCQDSGFLRQKKTLDGQRHLSLGPAALRADPAAALIVGVSSLGFTESGKESISTVLTT